MKAKKNNKRLLIFMGVFLILLLSVHFVYAETVSKIRFCDYAGVRRTFMILGIVINLVKIVVPLILMGSAMIGLSKTIVSGKVDDFKASLMQVIKQTIAGLVIFLLPTILDFTFDTLVGYDDTGFTVCTNCLLDTNSCTIPNKDPEVYQESTK